MKYIRQQRDSTCAIVALLNAKRFYGLSTPLPKSSEYEKLIDMAVCRNGAAIHIDKVAGHLGLRRVSIPREDAHKYFPFIFPCYPPKLPLHAVLAIGGTKDVWTVVNYRSYRGPTVESVVVSDLDIITLPKGSENQAFRQFWHIGII